MRAARIDGEVRIYDAGPLSLTEAFRAAKILAGWEVPVYSVLGAVMVGEPVCRNERGTR